MDYNIEFVDTNWPWNMRFKMILFMGYKVEFVEKYITPCIVCTIPNYIYSTLDTSWLLKWLQDEYDSSDVYLDNMIEFLVNNWP